jgi:hypothetical protein
MPCCGNGLLNNRSSSSNDSPTQRWRIARGMFHKGRAFFVSCEENNDSRRRGGRGGKQTRAALKPDARCG